ncbi:GcrA family cell cycle regulator [Bradyrhizobium oligotrophicum]|uniref:GcrA family cell cycle regulator n=1 Tax=Bradyrhizobium oligotrophicum TaxID=44255 RepID=UPI003EB9B8C6
MPTKPHIFTPERVEQLKLLWQAGLSSSQIAAELGNVTRNAVIGKIHRLGLSGPASSPDPLAPRKRKKDLNRLRKKILSSDETPSDEHRRSLTELNEQTCHWPVGDPTSAEFSFCGAPTISGLPYCPSHSRIAYQPAADRRKQKADESRQDNAVSTPDSTSRD